MARRHVRFAFIIFPHFVVMRFARFTPELMFFEDVASIITIELEKPDFLIPIQSIGENDQDLSFWFRFCLRFYHPGILRILPPSRQARGAGTRNSHYSRLG